MISGLCGCHSWTSYYQGRCCIRRRLKQLFDTACMPRDQGTEVTPLRDLSDDLGTKVTPLVALLNIHASSY
eukprot:8500810-Pyramimonas_sp.AAC.1